MFRTWIWQLHGGMTWTSNKKHVLECKVLKKSGHSSFATGPQFGIQQIPGKINANRGKNQLFLVQGSDMFRYYF